MMNSTAGNAGKPFKLKQFAALKRQLYSPLYLNLLLVLTDSKTLFFL